MPKISDSDKTQGGERSEMSRKIWVLAFMLLALVTTSMPIMVVVAQNGEAMPVAPETTFGWVILAWLIYAVAGLVASVTTSTEHFDAIKFARSLLIMLLTGLIAVAFRISPANVETQFGGLITTIANLIVNTALGVTLIYLVDKLWKIIANLKAKVEAARAAVGPGPPK